MVSKNNYSEKMRKIRPQKQRFSIRKFTVGAASVLIGLTFMPIILAELRSLYSQIDFVAGASTSIDMQTKGMNKAVGLEYLGKKLGIKSRWMIAFGDSGNDEAMLKYVGTSFATATALPEAKKAANQIIGSSEDSSVQKKILELLS